MENFFKIFKNNLTSILVLTVIFIAGAYLRIKCLLFNGAFWYNEVELGDCVVNSPYINLFRGLDHIQIAPPLFLVVCKTLLQFFGISGDIEQRDIILRVFPCLCSIISIPLFMYLVQTVFKNKFVTWISSLFLALNYWAIGYSAYFKQYTCEMMFALILLIIFYKLDFKTFSDKKLLIYGLITGISLWFALSTNYILIAGFLYLLIMTVKEKTYKQFLIFLLPFISSAILFLPVFMSIYSKNYVEIHNLWFNKDSIITDIFNINTYINNTLEMFIQNENILNSAYNSLIIHILVTALFIYVFIKNDFKNKMLFILPIILIILGTMMHHFAYVERCIIPFIPLFILLAVSPFIKININNKTISNLIGFTIIFFVFCNTYNKDIEKYIFDYYPHSRQQVMDLKNNLKPTDKIIIDRRGYDGYWGYYFGKEQPVISTIEWETENNNTTKFDKKDEILLDKLPKGKYYFFNPHPKCNNLGKYFYLNKKYRIIKHYNSDLLYMEKTK